MSSDRRISVRWSLLTTAAAIVALDRWSKAAIVDALPLYDSRTVVPGFFDLVHVRNTGIAFSLFANAGPLVSQWVLPVVSALALVAILAVFWRDADAGRRTRFALAGILAGAAGNLYDRLAYGYVVDFLDFYVGSLHWPAFNVADSAITVGAGLLLLDALRKPAKDAAARAAA